MISKIFHLADIHIRKGNHLESRYIEYDQVFNELLKNLQSQYVIDESCCVICGDVFHHKLQISSHGIVLFYKLIHGIADIMPLFIIQGNHDLLQEDDNDNNDLIKALLDNHPHENIFYFDKTSSYEYQNLHFGVVSIRDMLQVGTTSGMVNELPEFPKPVDDKTNIALCHTTVKNCKLHNYAKSHNGIPIEWFKGYDMVLLGDIHLQSVKYNKKHDIYYGYPGSLVQQDFGESIFNHGYLMWNLSNGDITIEKYHVFNTYSRANVKIVNENIMINAENYIPIHDFLEYEKKPNVLHLRLYCRDDSSTKRNNLQHLLHKNNITCHIDIITANMMSQNECSHDVNSVDITTLNSSDTIIEFFKEYGDSGILAKNSDWEIFFKQLQHFKLKLNDDFPEVISSKIYDKNRKIDRKIELYPKNMNMQNNVLEIQYIKFDWILSFGKNNVFKFCNNKISLINAPNGYGKSAFFECIVLGLFGEPIPSRYNKATSLSILNKKKPFNCDTSNIEISFKVNKSLYTIKRNFYEICDSKNKNIKRLYSTNVELYEGDKRIKTGTTVVNKWVSQNVCTLQDFLLSSMITQNFDNDFFKLKMTEQMELLDSVLHMDTINHICDVIKDTKKEYKDLLNHINTYIDALKPIDSFDSIKHHALEKQEKELSIKIMGLKDKYDTLNIDINTSNNSDCEETTIPIQQILDEEAIILRSIHKFDIQYVDVYFDHEDITIEQFMNMNKNAEENLQFDKTRSIQSIIVELRNIYEEYDTIKLQHAIIYNKKPTQHDIDIEKFKLCNTQYNRLKTKLKDVDVYTKPSPPEFNLEAIKETLNKSLVTKSVNELKNMIHNSVENKIDDIVYEFNKDCWACNKNFNTTLSCEIQNVIDYKQKQLSYDNWKKYKQYEKDIELFLTLDKEMQYWNNMMPNIELYENWENQYKNIQESLTNVQQTIANKQWILKETFEYQKKSNQVRELYEKLKKNYLHKNYYVKQKLDLKYEIETLDNQQKNLLIDITTSNICKSQEYTYNTNKSKLDSLRQHLITKNELFDHFVNTFKKYKSWIYNEKLLPVIIHKTNAILNNVFKERLLELRFMFVDNNVIFTVMDEGNNINIEKLSGAQSFAVSLSFRLSLSSIGISRFKSSQLFIDEGFCSFDQHNLFNVPSLIKNLKQMYDEMILVTHLEEIKTCADKVINITRFEGISHIKHQ